MPNQEHPLQPRLRLIEARTQQGLSQQDVANHLGTTHVNVSRWERGLTRPGPYFRRKLCALFGKSEQELDLLSRTGEGAAEVENKGARAATNDQANGEHDRPASCIDPAIPLLPGISLVGRDHDLAHVRQRLCTTGSAALTALNGLPGVGKTALAITIAHDPTIRAHFYDGILWAGLGPSPNVSGILSHWGTLLGISATQMASLNTHEAWAKALRTAIGSRTMLLIIDDAWTVEEALTFKVGGPNCAHLVTTRFPSIASHITVEGAIMLQELSDEQGMDLLRLLAPQIVDVEIRKAQDLVHAVGGLPLALTLMGNYLRKQAYTGQARRINAAIERLSDARERLHISEPHTPVESHPSLPIETQISLQSVIAVTDQLLSEQASHTLYTLSIFPPKPNQFSEEAALAVAACDFEILDLLNDTGLLESSGSGHYALHQTIADYARLHLSEAAAATAYERLITFALDYIEANKTAYELLDQESSTLLAALEAAHKTGRPQALIRLVLTFTPFMLLRAWYSLAEQYVGWAHEAATVLVDNPSITGTLLYQGQIAQKQGNFAQAEAYFQEGLQLARQINDPERICALLTELGWVVLKRGEFTQAEAYLQEGLALARQSGDQSRICALLKILGSVENMQGNYSQSETYLREGLAIARQIDDRVQMFTLLMNLGGTVGEQGNHAQAEKYFQEGLIIARQIGHKEGITALLLNLGAAATEQKHYAQAEKYFQEGLLLARQIGHREWTSILLLNLGETAIAQNNYTHAEPFLRESLEIAHQIERPQITAKVLYEYGNLYLYQHRAEEAEQAFTEILSIIPKGNQELFALTEYGLARVAVQRGNTIQARQHGEESANVLEAISHHKAKEVRDWLATLT